MLLISGGIFAGFALGIVTSGSALITQFNLGPIVLQLDGLLSGPGDAPETSRRDGTAPARRAVNPDRAVSSGPAAGAPAAARRSGDDMASGIAGAARQAPIANGSAASANSGPAEPAPAAPAPTELSWSALYARGHRAQSEGDLAAATHWYREAARLNPRHPAILYDLGYILQVQGDVDDAIDLYRQVIALDSNHAYARYDLGFLLQKKGDKAGAVIQYQKAVKLNPDNPYIYFDWGRILESNNDLAGARARYEKAVELAPERRPGTDARRRLAALNARTAKR